MAGYCPIGTLPVKRAFAHQGMDLEIVTTKPLPMPAKRKQHPAPEFLRKWRLSKNLTLEQVGNIIGVGSQAVHKWEVGKTPLNYETLKLLASAYQTDVAGLLFDPDDPVMSERVKRAVDVLKKIPSCSVETWLAAGQAMAPEITSEK